MKLHELTEAISDKQHRTDMINHALQDAWYNLQSYEIAENIFTMPPSEFNNILKLIRNPIISIEINTNEESGAAWYSNKMNNDGVLYESIFVKDTQLHYVDVTKSLTMEQAKTNGIEQQRICWKNCQEKEETKKIGLKNYKQMYTHLG